MTVVSSSRASRTGGTTNRWYLRYLTPALVLLAVLGLVPVGYTVYLSLTSSATSSFIDRQFSGAGGYLRLLGDASFWNAFWIQIVFVVTAVAAEMILGFLIALALNRPGRYISAVRTVLLAPAVLPTVVVALLFNYLLQSRVGAISYYVAQLGLPTDWLDHPASALAILVGIDVWQFTPLVAILILAGLQNVPGELLEAGMLDGAGTVRRIADIVIPFMLPTITTIGLLRLIDAVQVFPTIYVLTSGGPGESTNALNFWGFTVFFKLNDSTYGATIAVVLTLGTALLAFGLASLLLRRRARS